MTYTGLEGICITFENFCKEDKDILLGDETVKIFLNATGRLDDISRELKAFLDYVAGKVPPDLLGWKRFLYGLLLFFMIFNFYGYVITSQGMLWEKRLV